jgi:hypothetical protein
MVRLSRQDLEERETVAAMASVAGMSSQAFLDRFSYAVDAEAGRRIIAEPIAA